jgi:hypothetical protein
MLALNRTFLSPLVFLAGALIAIPAAAKDRPIIISAGSPLDIQHDEGWRVDDDRTISTNFPDNHVSAIDVTIDKAAPLIFPFKHQQAEVLLSYDYVQIWLQTDRNGQNLRVVTLGDAHFSGDFEWVNKGLFRTVKTAPKASVTELSIIAGAKVHPVTVPAGAHIVILIHYRDPGDPDSPAPKR